MDDDPLAEDEATLEDEFGRLPLWWEPDDER